jgi:hypothetical protein
MLRFQRHVARAPNDHSSFCSRSIASTSRRLTFVWEDTDNARLEFGLAIEALERVGRETHDASASVSASTLRAREVERQLCR